jgi:tetratricopeptide (TPR) repeat protein
MTSTDDVRRWSEELARDPGSLAFIPLGEALRQQRQHELATRVALRGLERHPTNADAHDLLARLFVDAGDHTRAFDEWHMALRYRPGHVGALKGLGFVSFNEGRLEDAERWLAQAAESDPGDASIRSGLAYVRGALGRGEPAPEPDAVDPSMQETVEARVPSPAPRVAPEDDDRMPWERTPSASAPAVVPSASTPAPEAPEARRARGESREDRSHGARRLFADLVGGEEQTALLLDENGFVLAGAYVDADGRDVAQGVGAQLSGVSDEAGRAMRHLDLGTWQALLVETAGATVAMAPAPAGGLVLIAATRTAPIGLVRRFLERVGARAREWIGGGA